VLEVITAGKTAVDATCRFVTAFDVLSRASLVLAKTAAAAAKQLAVASVPAEQATEVTEAVDETAAWRPPVSL
jgi:hypothetical protein